MTDEKMSADDSTALAALERVGVTDASRNELDEDERRVDEQARLRPANASTGGADHSARDLKVGSLQPIRGLIDPRCVRLCILASHAPRNHEVRILRRIGRRSVDEQVATSRHDGRLEAVDRSHQIVQLGTRLPSREEHSLLSNASGQLERC